MLVEETRRSHEHEQREQPFDNAPLRDDSLQHEGFRVASPPRISIGG